VALGVGYSPREYEQPLSAVGCSNIGRSYSRPVRIEPEFTQLAEPPPEAIGMSNSAPDVLQERVAGSHSANDTSDLGPQVALVVCSELLPCDGEGRARKTSDDHIDVPGKRAGVQLAQVSAPNRCRIQGLVLHPVHEDGRGEGVALDVGHHSAMESSADPEVETPDA
tara:strand:+ start:432 stop:932 length:501 start_codon:yes stop_codon:yes gene_type:complete